MLHKTNRVNHEKQVGVPDCLTDRLIERTTEPIQPPYGDGVAGPCELKCPPESWAVRFRPALVVLEDAIAASPGERIGLQIEVLIVGGDSGAANQHGALGGQRIRENTVYTNVDSLTEFLAHIRRQSGPRPMTRLRVNKTNVLLTAAKALIRAHRNAADTDNSHPTFCAQQLWSRNGPRLEHIFTSIWAIP